MSADEYEFVVDGALSDRAIACFPELTADVDHRHTTTRLTGALPDTAAVRGVMARLDTLGLVLLEFRTR
ncbi:hypothetical protein [Gordonia sp. SID5947]|uniref:hypothetical protein n=1 Tax=Gordonia sp. SID5947 TaxID=2690315 RepID=UPI001F2D269E|nr:hypothetical protein [Gordonia sp. SID5947]